MRSFACMLFVVLVALSVLPTPSTAFSLRSPVESVWRAVREAAKAEAAAVTTHADPSPAAPQPPPHDLADALDVDLAQLHDKAMSAAGSLKIPISENPNDLCALCATLVGDHCLAETLSGVQTACANATTPHAQAVCTWITNHQEEFTGYVVAKTKPLRAGYYFCMGREVCAHPPGGLNNAAEIFDAQSGAGMLAQLSESVEFISRSIDQSFSTFAPASPDSDPDQSVDDNDLPPTSQIVPSKQKKCAKCIARGTAKVMRHARKALRKICQNCPGTYPSCCKAACKWAAQHVRFVNGMLYAHVQPVKYAIGWCFGKHKCRRCHNDTNVDMDAGLAGGDNTAVASIVSTSSSSSSDPAPTQPAEIDIDIAARKAPVKSDPAVTVVDVAAIRAQQPLEGRRPTPRLFPRRRRHPRAHPKRANNQP